MTQSLDALIQDFISSQREFEKLAYEKLKEIFAEYWEKNPSVKAIVWVQYAHYFNDGDPCVFRVNDPYFTNAEGDDLEYIGAYEYDGNNKDVWCSWGYSKGDIDQESAMAISNVLTMKAMGSVMESVFGPDNKIIATREGFRVEDYSGNHD
jgi:hypothetical protein